MILCLVPYEKLVFKFDSAEEAFRFSYPSNKILAKEIGDDYGVFFYDEENKMICLTYFVKKNGKWEFKKDGFNFGLKTIKKNNYIIRTLKLSKKGNTLIWVDGFNIHNITDSLGSKFQHFGTLQEYTVVKKLPKDYYLIINDEKIEI